jgi:NAD(P)-dependent dehydrogenase (short-subunit alcohol dehydrogenase family)
MAELEGKVAVITGAASGMGAATVRLFVAEGARVVDADLDQDKGRALAGELAPSAEFVGADVSREDDVAGAIDRAVTRWDRLDVLFNNAGFGGARGPIESISEDDYHLTMDVLLKGPFLGMKHAAPVMKAQRSGSIINTASVAGLVCGEAPHLYSVAKAALIHLTRSVALELGEHIGEPEDIAQAALYLASDRAGYVTGTAHVVDGGAHAGRPWARQSPVMTEAAPIRMYRPPDR